MENLTKKNLKSSEELIKKKKAREYYMMEASGESRVLSDIRRKHGIQDYLERVEKALNEWRDRKKKHFMKEPSRERQRSNIGEKNGNQERRVHQPVKTHTGILTPKSEKELLLAAGKKGEEDDDCTCIPCSCTLASLCCFLSKNTKHY